MLPITPLILTYNEAPNLERTLARLEWAEEIVVVDSGSDDGTLKMLAQFPNVRVVVRPFDNHTAQWNFGVDLVRTEWVLGLDADYVCPESLGKELNGLEPDGAVDAYFAAFRYCVFGKPLRGTLYPARAVLFRKERCRYVPDGHTQRLFIPGKTGKLESVIDHDDRKPLDRWFRSQIGYARLEAEKLMEKAETLKTETLKAEESISEFQHVRILEFSSNGVSEPGGASESTTLTPEDGNRRTEDGGRRTAEKAESLKNAEGPEAFWTLAPKGVSEPGGASESTTLKAENGSQRTEVFRLPNSDLRPPTSDLRPQTSPSLSFQDKIRRTGWLAPLLVLPYCLIVKRGILDGWAGWFYALQRLCAEVMLAVEVVKKKLKNAEGSEAF